MAVKIPGPNITLFTPCDLNQGIGGGARLKNLLDVFMSLEANVRLLAYVVGERRGVTHGQADRRLRMTTVSVRKSSTKIVKAFGLLPILAYGFRSAGKADVVFAHGPGVLSGFPALITARLFRKPLLVDHVDMREPATPGWIYRLILKRADFVFVISRFLETEDKSLGSKSVVYLPVFVDADVFRRDEAARTATRARLGINEKDMVIGYAGSFSHIEGVPHLLRAFQRLSSRYATKLMVVGGRNTPDSDDVTELIDKLGLKEKVILVPQQPYQAVPQYLSACDIACSPKIDCPENRAANPIKIYEYMSMALPMVLSGVGEVSNVIENGVDGLLVKPGDEGDLEKALEQLLRDPAKARTVGERARKKVIENYTQQVMVKRIRDVLDKCVRKG